MKVLKTPGACGLKVIDKRQCDKDRGDWEERERS